MKIAIMQPYFFPYFRYFQLINAVDKFIVYDDVSWIKRGWINRNYILLNGLKHLITCPCKKVTQNRNINEIYIDTSSKFLIKIIKKIKIAYNKAPYFETIMPIIDKVFKSIYENPLISNIAYQSIKVISEYLGINNKFELSSELYRESRAFSGASRILEICRLNNTQTYINPISGIELYKKEDFSSKGMELLFLQSNEIEYDQFNNVFIPNLSIIDVLMFNTLKKTRKFIQQYTLI